MDELRYPIGKFAPVQDPTPEQRNRWIEELVRTGEILRLTVANLTEEQLRSPYRPGGWTIRQVVHHMADNGMNAFIRFKRALTEDHPAASSYREDVWAELSDYQLPLEPSLRLLEAVHIRFAAWRKSLR
ncbi:DinB family protein [Paenibacillus humicola]|uniref:DinB family protein n=1 Tax=Paenibacillus humicola TaxID=3110540 RepID=UPI00237AE90A|nr:DinB family protein [Paenibacillus humicola]